jgi:protoheme IX farnesyltransferase
VRFPPVIGWAAATGDITLLPVLMFALIFLWTPPHFWALALFIESDYARAGVPMMPVVAGERTTRVQIFLYTLPMAACALAPWAMGLAGAIYGIAALIGTALFLALSAQVGMRQSRADDGAKPERRLFYYSILYLFALFLALAVDRMMAA